MSEFYTNTLPAKTHALVQVFQQKKPAFLTDFYLSGGTGLSLQIGHRESEDLDFFNQQNFDPNLLQTEIMEYGTLEGIEIAKGTFNVFLGGVKLQFLEYPYTLLEPVVDWNGIKISSILDIACTKLLTLASRGSKKDFFDLFYLFDHYSIDELLVAIEKKYQGIDYNIPHILKSLIYFDTAESEPMPRMRAHVDWSGVKEKMKKTVKTYQF